MFSAWLTRAWFFLKAAPVVLFAVLVGVIAIGASRRAGEKALRAARVDSNSLPASSLAEQARQIDQQLESTRKAITHAQAATRARRLAYLAASRIETAGQPALAETLRNWNRD